MQRNLNNVPFLIAINKKLKTIINILLICYSLSYPITFIHTTEPVHNWINDHKPMLLLLD